MQHTTQKIEVSRGIINEQEARVAQQRQTVERAVADHRPADEAQARLLILEQSLLSMKRFLNFLERDLEGALSLHETQTRKRIAAREKSLPRPEQEIEDLADDFAALATDTVLTPDEDLNYLEGLARAMRPSRH
jgi:serine/threonine protein phosphatase PrpC